jgi:hypothetical protein
MLHDLADLKATSAIDFGNDVFWRVVNVDLILEPRDRWGR